MAAVTVAAGTVAAGTVAAGTVAAGTVAAGTVAGTVAAGTVAAGPADRPARRAIDVRAAAHLSLVFATLFDYDGGVSAADFDPDEWDLPPLDESRRVVEPPPHSDEPRANIILGSVALTEDLWFPVRDASDRGQAAAQASRPQASKSPASQRQASGRHASTPHASMPHASTPEASNGPGRWATTARHGGRSAPIDLDELVALNIVPSYPGSLGLTELKRLDACAASPEPGSAASSQSERVDAIVDIARHLAWLEALQLKLIADAVAADDSDEQYIVDEIGVALQLPRRAALARVAHARTLSASLPGTLAALRAGRISGAHATAMTDTAHQLPASRHSVLESQVLDRSATQTVPQLKQSLRRAALRLDPASALEKHLAALDDRCVRVTDADHGTAWLSILMSASDAYACKQRLDRRARSAQAEARAALRAAATPADGSPIQRAAAGPVSAHPTSPLPGPSHELPLPRLDQLRADDARDALLALDDDAALAGAATAGEASTDVDAATLNGACPATGCVDGEPARSARRRANPGPIADIGVLISASTLLGQDDEPAWLAGYGPITAEAGRALSHDPTSTWRRLITDPITGGLLHRGTTRYAPPAALAEYVKLRDGTCTFPACNRTAHGSGIDIDHVVNHPDGPTNHANLQPVDRHHHNLKTHARWKAARDVETGCTTWTSPQGRRYRTHPPERWTMPGDGIAARKPPTGTSSSVADDSCPF